MNLQDLPPYIIKSIISYIPQNDLLKLSHTSKKLHEFATNKLYQNIVIQRTPVLRTTKWYVDSTYTYITIPREAASKDVADYLLLLKLERLGESLMNEKKKYAGLVEKVLLFGGLFHDLTNGIEVLNEFIGILKMKCVNLKRYHNSQEGLIHYDFESLSHDTLYVDHLHEDSTNIPDYKESLTIQSYQGPVNFFNVEALSSLNELILFDEELATLRILKQISAISPALHLSNLKKLSLCHIHDLHDNTTKLRPLDSSLLLNLVPLEQVTELELTLGCTVVGCPCLDTFVDDLTPHLRSLRKISLNEKTIHKDHYHTENWDVAILRMLTNAPSSEQIHSITINHDAPKYGSIKNGVDGNYLRRRRLYEGVLSKFPALESVVSNTMLCTVSCYEILTSDLLWNGCECEYCQKFLPYFDEYLMNHGIENGLKFEDMLSPKLFYIAGLELLHRVPALGEISTLEFWDFAPGDVKWSFHGYDQITCYEDYDCPFNEAWFEPIVVCVSHFFREIVKVMSRDLPHLKRVAFSNVYFTVNDKREVECVYDN